MTAPLNIDVACTGPKTIQMAAEVADRISFAVGSTPAQLEWAVSVAENHLKEIGRPRESIQIGAYRHIVSDTDEQNAINLGRMIAGMVAHFAGIKGAPLNHLPKSLKSIAKKLRDGYDMAKHSQHTCNHLQLISDDFVDWFSTCGSAEKCASRLRKLTDLGLQHVYQLGGSPIAEPHG